ncbi:hypothetical protein ACVWYG_001170 [Pedobacter sp. UYEF25]
MNKLVSFFLLFFGSNLGYSQTYKITSFEGKLVGINLSQKPFTKVLNVSYAGDTLHFSDCTGTGNVKNLGKNFLQIEYNLRGGTGLDYRNTIVLCVSNQKIIISLFLESYVGALIDTSKHYVYQSQLKLLGNSQDNFKMIVHTHGDRSILKILEENVDKYFPLRFDKSRKIFLSNYKTISKDILIKDYANVSQAKDTFFVNGSLPVISLYKDTYYYRKGQWYEIYGNKWTKYYFR